MLFINPYPEHPMRPLLCILTQPHTLQADPLDDARTAHAKELTRLKADLLAAIDARLKLNERAGRGNDYLLPERKAFAENGVTPLLPEMQPAVRVYLSAKKQA